MAPQRQGSDEEDTDMRPKLATTLQGGGRSGGSMGRSSTEVAETACVKRPMDDDDDDEVNGSGGGGGGQEGAAAVCEVDDDLTNLTWLQNCNLLQGIHRQVDQPSTENGHHRPSSPNNAAIKAAPPASGVVVGGGGGAASKVSGADEFYNPTVHRHAKPPYSFSCLIFMAIEDSSTKALPVKDIYNWIFSNFPYFRNAPTGWKNSIRHNLSLNKCFYKVDKGQNIAKGSLWCVDPKYRHHLLHSLNKTPNAHYHQGIRLPTYNPLPLTNNNQPITATGEDTRREQEDSLSPAGTSPGPNPNLFPYLSKRLAASNTKNQEADAAATMLALKNGSALDSVKQKKVKPRLSRQEDEEDEEDTRVGEYPAETKLCRIAKEDARVTCRFLHPLSLCVPVPTNRPSKDHTYSTAGEDEESEEEEDEQPLELTTKSRTDPVEVRNVDDTRWTRRMDNVIVIASSTVREELRRRRRMGSQSEDEERSRCLRKRRNDNTAVDEEQKIVDGADALLNLAGIVTQPVVDRPMRRQRKPNRRNLRHLVR